MSSQKALEDRLSWELLVRHPHQKPPQASDPLDDYWVLYTEIANEFDRALDNKIPTSDSFFELVQKLHAKVYQQKNLPSIRTRVLQNRYPRESVFCLNIARIFWDPYCIYHNNRKFLALPHIPEHALPLNQQNFHIYPPPSGFRSYFQASYQALLLVEDRNLNLLERLRALSLFYQYLINMRPFLRNNNSLFMLFVNVLLKRLSLKGISHYILDHLAHRIHPQNFSCLFLSLILQKNAHLSLSFQNDSEKKTIYTLLWKNLLKLFSWKKPLKEELIVSLEEGLPSSLLSQKAISLFCSASNNPLFPFASKSIPQNFAPILTPLNTEEIQLLSADWFYHICPIDKFYLQMFPLELPRVNDADFSDMVKRMYQ